MLHCSYVASCHAMAVQHNPFSGTSYFSEKSRIEQADRFNHHILVGPVTYQIYHRPQTYRDCISNRKTTRLTCGTDMRNVWKMVSLPSLWIFFFSRNLRIQTPALVSAAGPSYLAGQSIQNEALLQTGNKNLNPPEN